MGAVNFRHVDVVFGQNKRQALELLDAGEDRETILARTDAVVGVADAQLDVHAGQICVLMGLSGSGKSSLLRCVNGLNQVTRGELVVEDGGAAVDVAHCDAATLRRLRMSRIAMVFQQFGLLPWRSVRDNVGFGLELRGLTQADINTVVDAKLALVHLEQWAEKSVSELSGGMQQRVGLARALATDADILLMDEPFSALDPLIRDHLQDELLDLQRELRKTILFVSHDLDEALKIGNHIVIMDGGRIVQQGSAEDIVFNPVNEYVRQFVANMNPLQVLNAGALMQPAHIHGETLRLDGGVIIKLDAKGAPLSASRGDTSLAVMNLNGETPPEDAIVIAQPGTRMRDLVAARNTNPNPILVADAGRIVGTVGEREIYSGLLRQGRR